LAASVLRYLGGGGQTPKHPLGLGSAAPAEGLAPDQVIAGSRGAMAAGSAAHVGHYGRRMGGKCGTLPGSFLGITQLAVQFCLRGPCAQLVSRWDKSFSEGQMRSLKLSVAATAMICALSATAQAADCVKVAVAGESLTHDLAVLFSTNGLKNIMAGQGRVGQGPVHTTCKTGSGTTTCHSSQMACKVTTPKTCLGAWLCL